MFRYSWRYLPAFWSSLSKRMTDSAWVSFFLRLFFRRSTPYSSTIYLRTYSPKLVFILMGLWVMSAYLSSTERGVPFYGVVPEDSGIHVASFLARGRFLVVKALFLSSNADQFRLTSTLFSYFCITTMGDSLEFLMLGCVNVGILPFFLKNTESLFNDFGEMSSPDSCIKSACYPSNFSSFNANWLNVIFDIVFLSSVPLPIRLWAICGF